MLKISCLVSTVQMLLLFLSQNSEVNLPETIQTATASVFHRYMETLSSFSDPSWLYTRIIAAITCLETALSRPITGQ